MNSSEKIHNAAIQKAELALVSKLKGNLDEAENLYMEAYELEIKSVVTAIKENVGEPSISILWKSASMLAINGKNLLKAEKAICHALSGNPPNELADELRDLLDEINFDRHLKLKGVELSENDLQMVFHGSEVGQGMVKSENIRNRLDIFEKLSFRTIERKTKKPFRETGSPSKSIKLYNTYYGVPRRASFALTIKIGMPKKQLEFEEFKNNEVSNIIDDIMENLNLVNDKNFTKLKENIPDNNYYRNFISLSKELAPDGEDIKLIGFTVTRNGEEKHTKFTLSKTELINLDSNVTSSIETLRIDNNDSRVQIAGRIFEANDNNKKIKLLVDSDSSTMNVSIPTGLGDIVKKYWGEKVIVDGIKKNNPKNTIVLVDINPQ